MQTPFTPAQWIGARFAGEDGLRGGYTDGIDEEHRFRGVLAVREEPVNNQEPKLDDVVSAECSEQLRQGADDRWTESVLRQ